MKHYANTTYGIVQWKWKDSDNPSAEYKSLNHQWWLPKKSDFEIISNEDQITKQEIKNEIWEDMQIDYAYTKELYKLHKLNKKRSA